MTFCGAEDVGLDRLEGVVLAGRHLLHRGGVDDDVDAASNARPSRSRSRTSPMKKRQARVVERELHRVLLQLVAAEDDHPLRVVSLQHGLHELRPERAGAAGDEDDLSA